MIPRLYYGGGKTFFSLAYEGTRERISRPYLGDVLTPLQRSGDFSDLVDNAGRPVLIYDPATTRPNPDYDPGQPVSLSNLQYLRDPFPGNRIPAHRLDPVALKALAYYPHPNTSVGPFLRNNFFTNAAEPTRPMERCGSLTTMWEPGTSSPGTAASPAGSTALPRFSTTRPTRAGPSAASAPGSGRFSHTFSVSPRVVNQFSLWARHRSLASAQEDIYGLISPNSSGSTDWEAAPFLRFSLGRFVDIGTQPGALAPLPDCQLFAVGCHQPALQQAQSEAATARLTGDR